MITFEGRLLAYAALLAGFELGSFAPYLAVRLIGAATIAAMALADTVSYVRSRL